jgi:integrase
LEWSAFLWDRNVIRIAPTKHFHPKSEHSIGDVEVDLELMAIFKRYHQQTRQSFVVEAPGIPKLQAAYVDYRSQEHFERLIAWLRSKGVKTRRPFHTLRKEFGSLINANHDIHAASRSLRHSSIAVTHAYYADNRRSVTVGLGRLLGEHSNP